MADIKKPQNESQLQRIVEDTSRLDRMRVREHMKKAREQRLFQVKKLAMPIVKPNLDGVRVERCSKCSDGSGSLIKLDDWFMSPIDALELKIPNKSWLRWLKLCAFRSMLSSLTDSLAIHPAQLKMIKNLQANNPEMPLALVVETDNPHLDLLLINFALLVNDVKLPLSSLDKRIRDVMIVGGIAEEMNFVFLGHGESIKESLVASHLQTNGNVLVRLDDLPMVLSACDFGMSKRVLLMPVSINSERLLKDFSPKLFSDEKLGIVKINFHEPYTIDGLLKTKTLANMTPQQQSERAKTITKHLRCDISTKRPIMSTNVVAFLLLTEFRDGATVDELAAKLDRVRAESFQLDFGFEGDARDVVEHAVEVLGAKLVEIECDQAKLKIENVNELSDYAHELTRHFALESVLVIAAKVLLDHQGAIDYSELICYASELCKLLDCCLNLFKPCENVETLLNATFERCQFLNKPAEPTKTENEMRASRMAKHLEIDSDDDEDEEEGYRSRDPSNAVTMANEMTKEIESLRNVTMPMLDAFITVAYALSTVKGSKDKITPEIVIGKSMRMMREDLEDGKCKYWESCSDLWMRSILNHLISMKLIEVNDTAVIRVRSSFPNNEGIRILFEMS